MSLRAATMTFAVLLAITAVAAILILGQTQAGWNVAGYTWSK